MSSGTLPYSSLCSLELVLKKCLSAPWGFLWSPRRPVNTVLRPSECFSLERGWAPEMTWENGCLLQLWSTRAFNHSGAGDSLLGTAPRIHTTCTRTHVYTVIYACAHIYSYIHVYTQAYTYTHSCIHTCMYMQGRTHSHTCTCTFTHTHTLHTSVHTPVFTCAHPCTHAHSHTRTCTHVRVYL